MADFGKSVGKLSVGFEQSGLAVLARCCQADVGEFVAELESSGLVSVDALNLFKGGG